MIVTDSDGPRDADQSGRRAAVRRASGHGREADRPGRARRAHRAGRDRRAAVGAGRGVGERGRGAAVGRRRRAARVPRAIDADARRRRSAGRRRHAARGHHAPERDQPAQVRVHRRRVARAAHAAHERADGHPPAARGRRRPARRTAAGDSAGVPRRHDAARSADAGAARSVEDRVGRGGARLARRVRPSVLVREAAESLRLQVEARGPAPRGRRAAGSARRCSPIATRSNG